MICDCMISFVNIDGALIELKVRLVGLLKVILLLMDGLDDC